MNIVFSKVLPDVEMRVARLRALTQFLRPSQVNAAVEMRVARLRALTQVLSAPIMVLKKVWK